MLVLTLSSLARSRVSPAIILYCSTPRRAVASATRWYRPTPRHLHNPLVGPYTWRARLRYRRDGTPRPKWKGLLYATAVSLCVIGYLNVKELATKLALVCWLVEVQRLDAKYPSYDLSQRRDFIIYFLKLVYSFREPTESEQKRFIKGAELLLEVFPEFHELVREELEKIHNMLSQDWSLSPVEMAQTVSQILVDLGRALVNLQSGLSLGSPEAREDSPDGELNAFEVVG